MGSGRRKEPQNDRNAISKRKRRIDACRERESER